MQATPSLMQAQQLKKRSQEGKLDESFIDGILASEKPNQKEKLSFKSDEIDYFFPKTYTPNCSLKIWNTPRITPNGMIFQNRSGKRSGRSITTVIHILVIRQMHTISQLS